MKQWKSKVIWSFLLIGLFVGSGCAKKQAVDSELYLRCNDTSNGVMAEIESGYFFVANGVLYYADKTNLELWVPVCNRPDCSHSSATTHIEGECNALTNSGRIIQKNGKIYDRGDEMGLFDMPYLMEITIDGSGPKKVYEVPWDEKSIPNVTSQALYQERLLFVLNYLDEKGYEHNRLIRLEEDENGEVVIDTLSETNDFCFSGNVWWSMKGDDVAVLSLDWDQDSGAELWRNLWRVDGEELEKLEIPNKINLMDSYLSGNKLTYYEQNDGFYQLNLDTGEKQLVTKNQLKDGRGNIFSDELIFEYNCYTDHIPEEMCIKVYNGKEWKDIQLPEEITDTKRICNVRALASDRVFLTCQTEKKFTIDLYYMMLDEKNPKLVYAGQISDKAWEEQYDYEEETTSGEDTTSDFEEIIVFDNEDGVLKVTDAKPDKSKYVVDLYFEVGDSGREYNVTIEALINGIQCYTNQHIDTEYSKKEDISIIFDQLTLKEDGVTDIYSIDEFTDIELIFYVNEMKDSGIGEEILKKSVHIYPKGEDAVTHYTREPQDTDIVFVNNEYAKITLIGYETTKLENDTPIFFVENKTDKEIKFSVDAASINGAQDHVVSHFSKEEIQGNACAFVKSVVGDERIGLGSEKNFWEEYDVTEIGTIQALLSVGYYDIGQRKEIGESFVEELITLYPKGEEYAREDARQSQATDLVLVDNQYIKMTLIGYEDYVTFDNDVIANVYARVVVENKTNEVLFSKVPTYGDNGIIKNSMDFNYILLPGNCYTHNVSGATINKYPEGQFPTIGKIEFLHQLLDKEGNIVNQEYITLYPLGEELVEVYELDMESMQEILVDDELFTIAVAQYANGTYNKDNPYPNCNIEFAFINKTDQLICLELDKILVKGVEHIIDEWTLESYVVFAQETSFFNMNVYTTVKSAGMTELEDVEMTFKVYEYYYQDGTLGEKLGSTTVTFGPKK